MPPVLLRLIQELKPGKWKVLKEINAKLDEMEESLGYPEKKRYRCLFTTENTDTIVTERVWESLAKMEEVMVKGFQSKDLEKINEELHEILNSQRMEILMPL